MYGKSWGCTRRIMHVGHTTMQPLSRDNTTRFTRHSNDWCGLQDNHCGLLYAQLCCIESARFQNAHTSGDSKQQLQNTGDPELHIRTPESGTLGPSQDCKHVGRPVIFSALQDGIKHAHGNTGRAKEDEAAGKIQNDNHKEWGCMQQHNT